MKLKKFNNIIENVIQDFTNREIDNNPEGYLWETTKVPYGDSDAVYCDEITPQAEQKAREHVCEFERDDIIDTLKDELSVYMPDAIEDEGFIIDLQKIIERRA